MTEFTIEELEWVKVNRLSRDRWLCSSNAKPILHDLCERGLMQPAYGEFGAPQDKGESMTLLGNTIPVFEMISLYMLTPTGQAAISKTAPREQLEEKAS